MLRRPVESVLPGIATAAKASRLRAGDWVLNGAIFTAFHLHQPWSMPATLLDGVFARAYPTKRFRSIRIAVVGHTLPSLVMIGVLLGLVLK